MSEAGTSTLDLVTTSLVNAAVGQITDNAADWYIYQNAAPDSGPTPPPTFADRILVLFETGGRAPLERWAIQYPSFQVMIRGQADDYQTVRDKWQNVLDQLQSNEGDLGVPPFVYCYSMVSGPINLGMDEKRRPKLAINFRTMRNSVGAAPP